MTGNAVTATAINADGIGKKYRVGCNFGRNSGVGCYRSLRDSVAANAKHAARIAGDVLHGRPIVSGGEVRDFWALKDVSFRVAPGEIVGVIGRNGAGKSTLLKLLSRITDPSAGRVEIRGRVASLIEVGTGFHPELTGAENIYLNGAILGMTRSEIQARFGAIVDFSGVENFLTTPVKRYSSGMQVRLAFAVAAHLRSEILLIDEVLAVGDLAYQSKCLSKIDDIVRDGGRTVLLVSHQLGLVGRFCPRTLLFDKGRIVFDGPSETALQRYISLGDAEPAQGRNTQPRSCDVRTAILRFEILDSHGAGARQLPFQESIHVRCELALQTRLGGTSLGIAIDDRYGSRVTTWVLRLADHVADKCSRVAVELEIPASIIAPGRYMFTAALFEPGLATYDMLEDVCPITIVDTGSEMARFEGAAYGVVILPGRWSVEDAT